MQEMQIRYPSQEDPLEKGMATHSSMLAWEVQWTEEAGGLQSVGSQRVGRLEFQFCSVIHPAAFGALTSTPDHSLHLTVITGLRY